LADLFAGLGCHVWSSKRWTVE